MKNKNNNPNLEPPKYLFEYWAKGLIKSNNIVKIKKKITQTKEVNTSKKDDEEDRSRCIFKLLKQLWKCSRLLMI